jgi:type II secretory pathway component PulJ
MSTRTDYHQIAERIDYAKLEKKLEHLREQEPPKKRKTVADLLAPVGDKLRELHAKGWTYEQLAAELAEGGLAVKVATLRNYLSGRAHGGKKGAKRRRSKSGSDGS